MSLRLMTGFLPNHTRPLYVPSFSPFKFTLSSSLLFLFTSHIPAPRLSHPICMSRHCMNFLSPLCLFSYYFQWIPDWNGASDCMVEQRFGNIMAGYDNHELRHE